MILARASAAAVIPTANGSAVRPRPRNWRSIAKAREREATVIEIDAFFLFLLFESLDGLSKTQDEIRLLTKSESAFTSLVERSESSRNRRTTVVARRFFLRVASRGRHSRNPKNAATRIRQFERTDGEPNRESQFTKRQQSSYFSHDYFYDYR